jgi:hypothetical protein
MEDRMQTCKRQYPRVLLLSFLANLGISSLAYSANCGPSPLIKAQPRPKTLPCAWNLTVEQMESIAEKIHSRKDSIPELGWIATDHVTYLQQERKVHSLNVAPTEAENFSLFHEEAKTITLQGQTTYDWWLLFNIRLAIMVSDKKDWEYFRKTSPLRFFTTGFPPQLINLLWEGTQAPWKSPSRSMEIFHGILGGKIPGTSQDDEQEYVDHFIHFMKNFPQEGVFFPTVKGNLALSDLNKTYDGLIWLLGLVAMTTHADDEKMPPIVFLSHDGVHEELFSMESQEKGSPPLSSIYRRLYRTHIEKTPQAPDSFQLNFWYFHIGHENNQLRSFLTAYEPLKNSSLLSLFKERCSDLSAYLSIFTEQKQRPFASKEECLTSFQRFVSLLRESAELPPLPAEVLTQIGR